MFDHLIDQLFDLAVAIQQIPAPTFSEAQRAAFVAERFRSEGLEEVTLDAIGNVYARLPGEGSTQPVVVSAHLDTVFPDSTDLSVHREADRIAGPGIGDNSLGVAGLFGLLWGLRQRDKVLPGDLWLVANVGEEGLGDLRGMRAVVERFGDRVLAYIVLEGMAFGQIYQRGLGVRRYRISIQTRGGHSWTDFGQPSAIHELARLVTQLAALPLPEQPRTTLNVGVISGGTTVNTIAAHAHLELDLRSESPAELKNLSAQVERLARNANLDKIQCLAEVIGNRPAGEISPDHPLICLAERSLQALGLQPRLNIGSTDANIPLSLGIPAICLGLTTGSGAHTPEEFIYTQPIAQGLEQLLSIVTQLFQAEQNST